MTLGEASAGIGRLVVYERPGVREEGTIEQTNSGYVFVRYRGDIASKATRPEDLSFSVVSP